ncbi:MAG: MFS transporter [Mucispirillum sp.]|nr:MFS transporter [Mucispirillum sp.]
MHIHLPIRLDPDTFSALKSRSFKIYLAGQSAAMTGAWIQKLANAWLVYSMTKSAFKLGLIELLSNAPIFLIGLLAGAWLEKHDIRKTMIATQILMMVHAAVMAVLVYSDTIRFWHVTVLSLYLGIVSAIDMPARQSSIILMVEERKNLKSALALQSMTFNLSRLVGPAIAGFIVHYAGEAFCFMMTAVLYIPVLYALHAIKFKERDYIPEKRQNVFKDIFEGMVYVKNFYPLRTMFTFLAIFGFFSYSYTVVFPVFAKDVLNGNSQLLGFIMGLFGMGAVVGAFSVASAMRLKTIPKSVLKVSVTYAVSMAIFALSPSVALSLIIAIPAGFGIVATFIGTNTLLQTITASNMRSRVASLYTICNIGLGPIGGFLAGILMETINPRFALLIWCAIMAISSLILFIKMKKLNRSLIPVWKEMENI